jgi:NCAIR mutase (PurE)-related protein
VTELLTHGSGPVLLTRATSEQAADALAAHPAGVASGATVVWRPAPLGRPERVVVAAAGTADLPVADECATVLDAYGLRPVRLTDVGVAGLHRILPHIDVLAEADAVVVVAGMEGALASVVGGLSAAPVVAVPTSAGYGASFGGVTALLAMLASCAAGVTVVGIDNGFGAACAVARACDQRARRA